VDLRPAQALLVDIFASILVAQPAILPLQLLTKWATIRNQSHYVSPCTVNWNTHGEDDVPHGARVVVNSTFTDPWRPRTSLRPERMVVGSIRALRMDLVYG
jgi:hypothetical protein